MADEDITEDQSAQEVNPERLGQWMDTQDLPGRGEPVQTSFISGGTSNVIYRIQRGDFVSVLRRPPVKVPPGRNETMLREFRVLNAINGTDVPHPEAYAVCDDT
jgi:aminoglycoside phosphotransferase (APT) family kinase protein